MKKRSRVRFKFIEIMYFSRCLGIDKVPEKGNNPLGMECYHFESEKIDIAKRKLQNNHFLAGDSLINIKNLSTSTPKSSKSTSYFSEDESESIHSIISIDFTPKSLQPLNPIQRKKCLESAGVDIDDINDLSKNPKNLSKLREGRKQVGCKCSNAGKCDATKCICNSEGIPCQTDGNKFPCKCGDKCSNKFGKRTYSYAKIKFHYQHTLNRLPSQFEDVNIDILSTLNGDCVICSTVADEIWNKYPEAYHQTRSRKRESNLFPETGAKIPKQHPLSLDQVGLTTNGFRDTALDPTNRAICSTLEHPGTGDHAAIKWPSRVDAVLLANHPIINRRLSMELVEDGAVDLTHSQRVDLEDDRYTNKENISSRPSRVRHKSGSEIINTDPITSSTGDDVVKDINPIKSSTMLTRVVPITASPIALSLCGDIPSNCHDVLESSLCEWSSFVSLSSPQPTGPIGQHGFSEYLKSFLNISECSPSGNGGCHDNIEPSPLLLSTPVIDIPTSSVIFNSISLATPVIAREQHNHDLDGDSGCPVMSDCVDNCFNVDGGQPLLPLVPYLPSPVAFSSVSISPPVASSPLVTDTVAIGNTTPRQCVLRTIRDAPNYVESPLDHSSRRDQNHTNIASDSVVDIDDQVDFCFFDIPVTEPHPIGTVENEEFLIELCHGSAVAPPVIGVATGD